MMQNRKGIARSGLATFLLAAAVLLSLVSAPAVASAAGQPAIDNPGHHTETETR